MLHGLSINPLVKLIIISNESNEYMSTLIASNSEYPMNEGSIPLAHLTRG